MLILYIYDNFDSSNLSNLLAQKLNQNFNEPGYYSVALDTPLPLSSGDEIAVDVQFTNNSGNMSIAIDHEGPMAEGHTYLAVGIATPPTIWNDIVTAIGGELGIRLRTSIPPVAAFSAEPLSGDAPLDVNFND
ncbi:lectin like domain-containing protein [Chloroflexota bacterium]